MKNKEEPKDLLAELEMLQRVLDNPTSASGQNDADIPVLDDMFDGDIPTVTDIPTINEVAEQPSPFRPIPAGKQPEASSPGNAALEDILDASKPEPGAPSSLSPLNQILNKINRESAGDTVPSEPVSTNSALTDKRAELDANMAETTASLTTLLHRERMVDELVEELMPMIKSRLRARIRDMLNNKEDL